MEYSPACIVVRASWAFGYIDFDAHRSLLRWSMK